MSKKLGIIIFDHLNDVIYVKWNQNFMQYLQSIAVTQGLLPAPILGRNSRVTESLDSSKQVTSLINQGYFNPNIIVQLFSPLVTSYHIMGTQFKNSYESVFCEDGTTIVFQQYSNFLFLCVGAYPESFLQRFTNICIQMVKLIVGPCVSLLKSNKEKNKTLDNLLSAWLELYAKEQSYLVEAIERLIVNQEISAALISTLSVLVNTVTKTKEVCPCHALLFVRNKLLNLYSSKHAEELSEADLLSLNLVLKANTLKDDDFPCINVATTEEERSPPSPTTEGGGRRSESEEGEEEWVLDLTDENLSPPLKQGNEWPSGMVKGCSIMLKTKESAFSPHLAYMYQVTNEISLITVIKVNRSYVAGHLLEILYLLNSLKNEDFTPKEVSLMNIIDNCLQKSQESIKQFPKATFLKVRKSLSQMHSRWESLKKSGMEDWLKSPLDGELPSRLEAGVSALLESTQNAWAEACILGVSPLPFLRCIELASLRVKEMVDEFLPSLEAKALKNMALGSHSIISINKYLEEFPGLVHFLYVDRSVHQLTAPLFWVGENRGEGQSETQLAVRRLSAAKIWSMVEFARSHLYEGHTSLLWKDKTFNYSYFLWFEDQGGNPLKPVGLDKESLGELPLPGILCGDFYKEFAMKAFPDMSSNHIRIFELFCIHLGMTTSPCILEQTRRLAATVWEIAGPTSANPIDLL